MENHENHRAIAYFSMEVFLDPGMPTYSGGLGVLAGDALRSAADLKVPMVGVTLLSRKGYFRQKLDAEGRQVEEADEWAPEKFLERQPAQISVALEGRTVRIGAWKRELTGISGHKVPVFFLDTQLPENAEWDRTLTDVLYGGDDHYRLCQEIVLGIGGVRMLQALGFKDIRCYHMNDGHPAFLAIELLDQQRAQAKHGSITAEDVDAVRHRCVFTMHTPVGSARDQFPIDLVTRVLGQHEILWMKGIYADRRSAEHALHGAEPEPLRQWRGPEARRGLAPDVCGERH